MIRRLDYFIASSLQSTYIICLIEKQNQIKGIYVLEVRILLNRELTETETSELHAKKYCLSPRKNLHCERHKV